MKNEEDTESVQPGTEQQADTADTNRAEELEQATENAEETEQETEENVDTEENSEDTEGNDAEEEQPEPKTTKRSASETIRALKAERNAERVEREKIIAERAVAYAQLENLRQQQRDFQSTEQKRAEEQRLALLAPEERALYEANQRTRTLEHRLNQMEAQRADDRDRASFQAKAQHDETYEKYADAVEQMYQEGLAKGVTASREDLHSYLLGKELKKDMASKISKKKEIAGKRIESVTAKSASAKGDVAGAKKGRTEEDRLRNVLI